MSSPVSVSSVTSMVRATGAANSTAEVDIPSLQECRLISLHNAAYPAYLCSAEVAAVLQLHRVEPELGESVVTPDAHMRRLNSITRYEVEPKRTFSQNCRPESLALSYRHSNARHLNSANNTSMIRAAERPRGRFSGTSLSDAGSPRSGSSPLHLERHSAVGPRRCGRITVVRSKIDVEAPSAPAAMAALDAIRPAGVGGEEKVSDLSESR